MSTYSFTARERRAIDLIIRLSLGCQSDVAIIHPMNRFMAANLPETDVREILEGLVIKRVIFANMRKGHYKLNQSHNEWLIKHHDLEGYTKLIGHNINKNAPQPDGERLLKINKALLHCLEKLTSSPKTSKKRKAYLVKYFARTKQLAEYLLSKSRSSTSSKSSDSTKQQPSTNTLKNTKEKQQADVVEIPSSGEEIDKLTKLFQSATSTPSDDDRDYITGLVEKYDADYVFGKLEQLKAARNTIDPRAWLVDACQKDYQLSATKQKAKQLEEQRKANVEAQAEKREMERVESKARKAKAAEMETIKEAMSQEERDELWQEAEKELRDNGYSEEMVLPDVVVKQRENAIIERRKVIKE